MQLKVNQLDVRYGSDVAVKNLSFELEKGDIACLLGPSGCGKTTLQRAIAGFEPIAQGHIELAGKMMNTPTHTTATEHRKVGMVFQDFALFPHLNIAKNIGFGLHHLAQTTRNNAVSELLTFIGLAGVEKKYPHELSGGQQQRVALARAIAPQPDIILLDEAFSSLDATLRESLARDVRDLLKAKGITAILASHNQFEAFAIADKIGVMNKGELIQWDSPYQIYHQPNSRFVSEFIGEGNLIHAQTNQYGELMCALGEIGNKNKHGLLKEKSYTVLVRPDDISYNETSPLKLEIIEKRFRGAKYIYRLKLDSTQWIQCETPSHVDQDLGSMLPITTDFEHLVLFSES